MDRISGIIREANARYRERGTSDTKSFFMQLNVRGMSFQNAVQLWRRERNRARALSTSQTTQRYGGNIDMKFYECSDFTEECFERSPNCRMIRYKNKISKSPEPFSKVKHIHCSGYEKEVWWKITEYKEEPNGQLAFA